MDKKITRRAVLGTVVAGLAVAPFVMRAWLGQRQVELPPDSFLAGLRTRFEPRLSFPRDFDVKQYDVWLWSSISGGSTSESKKAHRESLERFRALPQSVRDTIVETQKRYWKNFAQIDEVEFDCTNFYYDKDGTKKTNIACFEGHVRLKYGYGLMIEGKDATGKIINWVFNLDGEISAIASRFNLPSIALDFFGAREALPSKVLSLDHVYSKDAELPNSPYLQSISGDRYTVLSPDRYLQNIELPPHIMGKIFYKKYYNSRTGMLDYRQSRTFGPDSAGKGVIEWRRDAGGRVVHGEGDRFLNPKYTDPSVPLPKWGGGEEYWKNAEVERGIFLPTEYANYHSPSGIQEDNRLFQKTTYSNIRVKRI